MDVINNQNKLLSIDLKIEIKKDNKLIIVALCFSIYAFAVIKKELKYWSRNLVFIGIYAVIL